MKKTTVFLTAIVFCFTLVATSLVYAHYSPNGPHYHNKPKQTQQRSRGFSGFLEDTFGIGAERDEYRPRRTDRSQRRYQRPSRQRYERAYDDDEYRPGNYYRRRERHARRSTYVAPPHERYGDKLCESDEYECIVAKRGDSWEKLFPNETQRDIVKRLNRVNIRVYSGMKIAIPKDLDEIHLLDVAPLDRTIQSTGKKLIVVDLPKLAWAAYDENGIMQHWGPVSGGRDYCPDIDRACNTIQGVFSVFNKKDKNCFSKTFPADTAGGAPMPYCMFFHGGYALHGSYEVPGYNASHGCVRMYKEDAKWLNEEFVETPIGEFDDGTEVIVRTS